jgi:putative SOS response-associated peptidase YedK
MCGRVVQASNPLRFTFVDGLDVPDSRAKPPSYNVAPSQLLYVIRENRETSRRTLELLRWGLIPHGCSDPEGGRKPINARAESVARVPTFRAAYAKRRCIVPVDCFFEWRASRARGRSSPSLSRCKTCPFRKFHPAWIRTVRQNHRIIESDVCDPARARNVRRRPVQVAVPARG